MAKSARASSKKSSKAKLRATVHGPQQDARLQRLSDKLVALATADQSNVPTSTMEVDEDASKPSTEEHNPEQGKGQMDLDHTPSGGPMRKVKGRIVKHSKGKRRASSVFPSLVKRKQMRQLRKRK